MVPGIESAQIAMKMDGQMGPHEVVLADDNAYQYAWTGVGTEVSLTYDLRDSVAWGPVIAWGPLGAAPAPSTKPLASATPAPVAICAASIFDAMPPEPIPDAEPRSAIAAIVALIRVTKGMWRAPGRAG